jgi:hypothetical protein
MHYRYRVGNVVNMMGGMTRVTLPPSLPHPSQPPPYIQQVSSHIETK